MKRVVDVAIGLMFGVLALPAIVMMAVITGVELRTWPFFAHDRVGRDGQLFRFLKLRTLPASTSPYADKYEIANVPLRRFGAFLRRHHLDELPQLYLVVLGRMSLVGPRPEMLQLHRTLDAQFAFERTCVRPGCTGLWQIGAHCTGLIGESPEFDRFYLRNVSPRLDAWILARTIRNAFPGRRLVSLDDVPAWTLRRRPTLDLLEAVETADV